MPTYTITIPGLSQIFRFTSHNPEPMSREELDTRLRLQDWEMMTGKPLSPEAKAYLDILNYKYDTEHMPQVWRQRERIQQMKAGPSPIPEPLRWIPDVINAIDDAQDILYTAAYLARPLLKRIPGRFIPYVGWGLLAMDIANLINSLLAMGMTPCLIKPSFIKDVKHLHAKAINPTSVFNAFVAQSSWRRHLGALLQGLQAAYTIFDRGMVLGGIMGMMSDAVWSSIQYFLQKGDVNIQWKLGRGQRVDPGPHYLIQTMKMQFWRDILSPEDHILLLAAQKLAQDAMCEQLFGLDDQRIETSLSAPVPAHVPWAAPSIDALNLEGVPIDDNTRPAIPGLDNVHHYEELLSAGVTAPDDWALAMRMLLMDEERKSVFWMMAQEMGQDAWTCLTGIPPEQYVGPAYYQQLPASYVENPWMIDPETPPAEQQAFLDEAATLAQGAGKEYPQGDDFKAAAEKRKIPYGSKSAWCKDADHACYVDVSVSTWPDTMGIQECYVELSGPEEWAGWTEFRCYVRFWGVKRGTYYVSVYHPLFEQINPGLENVELGRNSWNVAMKRKGPNIMPTGYIVSNCAAFKQY